MKKNFPDVRVLIFATAEAVTNHEKKKWEKNARADFDLELIPTQERANLRNVN